MEISIVYHIGLVLSALWLSASLSWSHPIIYVACFIYLYQVNERSITRLRKRMRHEEMKQAHQKRVVSDSETVRWLNYAMEKIWPVCMEQVASQKLLKPVIPWFLDKFKPWTASKAVMQQMYLGRNPPMLTEIRVLSYSPDEDHLGLELGMNFLAAEDMSAILAVKLRKRLGFGMWTNMHITGMHVEGKVMAGIRFKREWPFIQRLRICFVEPPYFQMTVKPIFSVGLDVTEVPGIAGWLDSLLTTAFEETLVQPNMLVVDVDKIVGSTEDPSKTPDSWLHVDMKNPVAVAKLEIIEAAELKPSDANGLADPYVKGQMGKSVFKTSIQWKTLYPKWHEEYHIRLHSWDTPNILKLEVRDKDLLKNDDMLGDYSLNINDLRGGQRHDKWVTLDNIKMGRLHLAITVIDEPLEQKSKEGIEVKNDDQTPVMPKDSEGMIPPKTSRNLDQTKTEGSHEGTKDQFEPIPVIEGQLDSPVYVHYPGSDVATSWVPRKAKARQSETQVKCEEHTLQDSTSTGSSGRSDHSNDEDKAANKGNPFVAIGKNFSKMGQMFSKKEPKHQQEIPDSPRPNLKPVSKGSNVNLVLDVPDEMKEQLSNQKAMLSPERDEPQTPGKLNGNGKISSSKNLLKQAGKTAGNMKHRLSIKGSSKTETSSYSGYS